MEEVGARRQWEGATGAVSLDPSWGGLPAGWESRKLCNWKVLGVEVHRWVCSEVRDLNHELRAGSGWAESCRREEPSWEVGGFDRKTWAVPRAQIQGILLLQILAALDRDASCRKHKLRQKLEQIIGLVSSNS